MFSSQVAGYHNVLVNTLSHGIPSEAVNLTDAIILQPTILNFMFDFQHQLCSDKN